jgi:hypothetical protein
VSTPKRYNSAVCRGHEQNPRGVVRSTDSRFPLGIGGKKFREWSLIIVSIVNAYS